jgi:DNA-binding MarR family transcriptional regulator
MADKNQADIYLDHAPGIGLLLSRAQGLYRARLTELIEGHKVHIGHVQILSALQKQPGSSTAPLTQTRLGRITGIEKSSLVVFLDDMEKRGWVQRQAHPSDRRAYVIALTSVGLKRHAAINKVVETCEQEVLSFLTKSQRAVFSTFLTELIQNLEAKR